MRVLTCCAVLLLGAVSACADDPPGAPAARIAPTSARAATDPLGNINRLPPSLEQKVGLVRADLETRGYAVARGYWTLWGIDDCKFPMQAVGYCYGNNPTSPYVLAVLPPWKDEFVDQRFHHILTEPQRNMIADYRLGAREALVILAEMPPAARYFGIGSNVFTREAAFNPNDIIIPRVAADSQLENLLFGGSPDPLRRMMIASIGNAINNVVMERQTGAPAWDQQRYFVITSDQGLADAMTTALGHAGVASSDVFIEPVSPQLVHLGLNRPADDLITYIRYSLPENETAAADWRRQLPLTILRVRDTSARQLNKPFAVPTYTPRAVNFDETVLANDFKALLNAVRAHWGQPQADTMRFFSAYRFLDLVGQHCLGSPNPSRGPMDCLGDTQDADYQISPSFRLDSGQVIAAVGTLATQTGNATYVSVSVNWFPKLVGVENIDDTALDGTAHDFAGALTNDSRLFYVYYVARDCTGLRNCIEVPRKLVPVGEIIKLIQRNYIKPGSTTGPDPMKLLNPVGIVLDGRHRPQ
ncbi:MAG: hypothetical protein ACM3SX_02990 [Deltaproteobacteria bacterium]